MEVKFFKGLNSDSKSIREDVFVKEQHFINEFDELDSYVDTMVIYDNNLPIATGRLYEIDATNKVFKLGRIAVIKKYRKQGIGRIVLHNLENKAKELGAKSYYLSAQVVAVPFYNKCGYIEYGKTYYEEHIEHISMKKQAN